MAGKIGCYREKERMSMNRYQQRVDAISGFSPDGGLPEDIDHVQAVGMDAALWRVR